MKTCLVLSACILVFVFAGTSYSQSTVNCPAGFVCISPEAARKMLEQDDKVKALEAESAVKDKAIADLKKLNDDKDLIIANQSGKITGLETSAVRTDAIVDLLLKQTRKKCLPLSVCF